MANRSRGRRWGAAFAAVFVVRTAWAALVHGPLLLTPLVYARLSTTMNPAMNLPALLAVEALITVLLIGAYVACFRTRRPSIRATALFGGVFGVAVYLPQNLLNLILLAPIHGSLVAAWVGAGVAGAVLSALVLRAVLGRLQGPESV